MKKRAQYIIAAQVFLFIMLTMIMTIKAEIITEDQQAPTVSDGNINVSNTTLTRTTLSWDKASDNSTPQEELQYCVYQFQTDNINTIENMEQYGTLISDYTADKTTLNVTGLLPECLYYFNVIVKDKAGNKAVYSKVSVTTNSYTPVGIESAAISPDNTYVDIKFSGYIFGEADNFTKLTADKLKLEFKQNGGTATDAKISDVTIVNNTGLEGGKSTIRVLLNISGIPGGVETIQIKPAGPTAIYDELKYALSDSLTTGVIVLNDKYAPIVSNGSISFSDTTQTSTILMWSKASDHITPSTGLEYCIYVSSTDNINTVADVETNGTVVRDYTANIGSLNVTGLKINSSNYFNVIVRDNAGNKACYNQALVHTDNYSSAYIKGASIVLRNNIEFVDVEFSEGVFNILHQGVTKDSLRLIITQNGGTVANAVITSVKKNDGYVEADASELKGEETIIRVFIDIIGLSSGVETIQIKPCYAALYDMGRRALNEELTTGEMLLPDKHGPIVSNRNIGVSIADRTRVTVSWDKASDLITAEEELAYQVFRSKSNINDIKTVEEITANGLVLDNLQLYRGTFCFNQFEGSYYYNIVAMDKAGNKSCYNSVLVTVHPPPPVTEDPPIIEETPTHDLEGELADPAPILATGVIALSSDMVTITTGATISLTGTALGAITESQAVQAIRLASAATALEGSDTAPRIRIEVNAPADTQAIEINVPKAAINTIDGANPNAMIISTGIAAISFDKSALHTISSQTVESLKISASKVDTDSLAEEIRQKIGGRPVFNFRIASGDTIISAFNGNVEVTIPYTPAAEEDTNAIVVYYVNAAGNVETVNNGRYDPTTGTVSFSTTHFSQYAVGYNKVNFNDVSEYAWYSKAVSFVAARDIDMSSLEGNFRPEDRLTRGQFIVMVMRAYNIHPDENPKENFKDAGDTLIAGYLAAAKRLGISEGVGSNMYAPDRDITRQEMITMLNNILKITGKMPLGGNLKSLTDYGDADQIASWAKEAMSLFVNSGIITGNEDKLSPTASANKAQITQVLYNLMSR